MNFGLIASGGLRQDFVVLLDVFMKKTRTDMRVY